MDTEIQLLKKLDHPNIMRLSEPGLQELAGVGGYRYDMDMEVDVDINSCFGS